MPFLIHELSENRHNWSHLFYGTDSRLYLYLYVWIILNIIGLSAVHCDKLSCQTSDGLKMLLEWVQLPLKLFLTSQFFFSVSNTHILYASVPQCFPPLSFMLKIQSRATIPPLLVLFVVTFELLSTFLPICWSDRLAPQGENYSVTKQMFSHW